VDVKLLEGGDVDPAGGLGLGTVLAGLATDRAGVEADGELLADLPSS
jgi:hypothetical protein